MKENRSSEEKQKRREAIEKSVIISEMKAEIMQCSHSLSAVI